ncbi:site-2 protease family protein [Candidatus Parcubacteria bacterium]|jgi:Zn-dependent protease|nr:MAG: site-2 protease family protein [Candidatus Parcubacteria bacterium]
MLPLNYFFAGQPLEAIASLLAIVIAITVHEFSHAFVSLLQGDSTAELEGRVTLNPLSHVDPFGLLALIFLGFGWGKPVPFNPYNLKFKRWGPALVSLAGPFSNLLGVIVFGLALRLVLQFTALPPDNLLITFLFLLVAFNIVLMIFNLLPIPPLDGSKLLNLLPQQFAGLVQFFNKYGFVILIAIIIFGQGYLSAIFSTVERGIFSLIIPG